MTPDPNAERKRQILERSNALGISRIAAYVEGPLFDKIDQAGPFAGAWLEGWETRFDQSRDQQSTGALADFTPDDFDRLFLIVFGYPRLPRE